MAPTVLARFRNTIKLMPGQAGTELWLGWSMAIFSTVAFSVAPPVARAAIAAGMDPTTLLTVRLIVSSILLGSTIVLAGPGRLWLDQRGMLVCSAAGLANGIGMLTFFLALGRIEASIASMIFSLSPLVVLGFLALRGEKFTRRHLLRSGLGLLGVYLLLRPGSGAGTGVDWLGVSLILVTILTFAIHLTLIQWFLQGYEALTVTFYVVVVMTLVSSAWWLILAPAWRDPGWSGWLAVATLAVVSTYLARLSLFAGVRSLGSGQVALLAPMETLLSVTWSILFLSELLTLWQWLGGIFILTSTLLAVKRLNRARWRPRWRVWSRP